MSDKVLVTGISGFLGGHVALQLLLAGYSVRGSVRDLKRANQVRETLTRHGGDPEKLEFVALDLLSDDGWEDAAKGCRYVQHVASPYVITMPKDRMDLIRPAREGTERAINAALAANVERIILTSSMAAIMYGHGPTHSKPLDESDWTNLEGHNVTAYVESKTLAERRAWEMMQAAKRGNDLVAINPSAIYGPLLDTDPGTSGLLVQRLLNGSVPAAPRIILPSVDVRDVAEIHFAAMADPEAGGKRFATSAGNLSIVEMAKVLGTAFPAYARKLPKLQMPDWAVRLYALIDADVRGNLGELGLVRNINSSRAKKLLGHEFIPAGDALTAMAQTIVDQRLI